MRSGAGKTGAGKRIQERPPTWGYSESEKNSSEGVVFIMNQTVVSIICAVITGLFSLWGVYAANRKSQALIAYRLEELEKKVNKHNQIVERTYKLEGEVVELQHDVRDMKGVKA